jgi:hypothetical protein
MDLRDATLMFLIESAAHPAVSEIAQSAYDRLIEGEDIDYRVLSDLVDEASGKGVLRAMHHKHGPAAFEAIVMPVLQEIGQRAPIRSTRSTWQPGEDPLTAGLPSGHLSCRYGGITTPDHGRRDPCGT